MRLETQTFLDKVADGLADILVDMVVDKGANTLADIVVMEVDNMVNMVVGKVADGLHG